MPRACRDDDTAKTSDVCSISARVSATRRCVGELRFNENDIAFGIVGIDEIERIHRELAYACAELGANRFERRFRANIIGGFNCVEDVEDLFSIFEDVTPARSLANRSE